MSAGREIASARPNSRWHSALASASLLVTKIWQAALAITSSITLLHDFAPRGMSWNVQH